MEYSERKELIKRIKSLKTIGEIVSVFHTIPEELLLDEELKKQLLEANPLVQEYFNIFVSIPNDIEKEIKENGLKNAIEKYGVKSIPREYRNEMYELAQEYEKNEEYKFAQKIYERVFEQKGNVEKLYVKYKNEQIQETLYYKAKFAYYVCKIKNGEKLTKEDEKDLQKLAEEDKNNIMNLTTPGKVKDIDYLLSYFKEDIPVEVLEKEILPNIRKNNPESKSDWKPGPIPGPDQKSQNEELSAKKRFEFFKEKYDIECIKVGDGNFRGYFLIYIKDSNVIIVEKFYELKSRANEYIEASAAATYFVHKDANIDLTQLSLSNLVERGKKEKNKLNKAIDKVNHFGETYYERVIKRFDEVGKYRKELDKKDDDERNVDESTKTESSDISGDAQEEQESVYKKSEVIDAKDEIEEKNQPSELEMLLFEMKKIDSEYDNIKLQIEQIKEEIQNIGYKIEEIKKAITGRLLEKVNDEIISIIKDESAVIDKLKIELKRLNELKEETIEKEKENREKRSELVKGIGEFLKRGE